MADAPPPSRNGRLAVVGLLLLILAAIVLGLLFLRPDPPASGNASAGEPPLIRPEPEGGPEQPIAYYLARADAARGQAYFARCASCHTVEQGGSQSIGPNLWGVMGGRIAGQAGFSYSAALQQHGGRWDWEAMAAFLHNPRQFAPGTRMAYSGIWNPQDRADVLLYLNSLGGTLTPPAPAR